MDNLVAIVPPCISKKNNGLSFLKLSSFGMPFASGDYCSRSGEDLKVFGSTPESVFD